MVRFNELKITPDAKHLIIDVSVLNDSYYDNVYIDSIIIDTQDTYVGSGPSSNPVYSYSVPETESKKELILNLDSLDLGSMNELFFVYARVRGIPSEDTPCGMDNVITLGTTCNMYPFYQQAMNYLGEIAHNCSVPQTFIDYILKLKGLKLAIKTGNYTEAIKYYNKFFKGKYSSSINTGGCGCENH